MKIERTFKKVWNPNTRGYEVLAKKEATETWDSEQVNYFKNLLFYVCVPSSSTWTSIF